MAEPIVTEPGAVRDEVVDALVALLIAGGEVAAEGLRGRVLKARRLVMAFDGERVVGLAAIKAPSGHYRAKTAADAGVPDVTLPETELGYLVVDAAYRGRGIGALLMRRAAAVTAGPAFATSRSATVQGSMGALGFEPLGRPWITNPAKPPLTLFVRGS